MNKVWAKKKAEKYLQWAKIAELKANAMRAELEADSRYKDFNFWTEPIKIGHHSERSHRRAREGYFRKEKEIFDLLDKVKRHRKKSENLIIFADRMKGDAERERQAKREVADQNIEKGSRVYDPCFRYGVVEKVNKKTYTVRFDSGFVATRDKSYFV